MGVFDDKRFEQLDWLSQMTETIESELNELLARLPDRIELSMDTLLQNVHSHLFSVRSDSVVRGLLEKTPEGSALGYDEIGKITDCFQFEMSPVLEIDLATGKTIGSAALVKKVPTLTDEQLQSFMGSKGIEALRRINFETAEEWPLGRMNEMLDVLGQCSEAQKNRSYKKKLGRLRERLKEIFTTNEWRIRDMALADKVGNWVADYISDGNLAALTNLCKLKVMTHKNMPIYSMEEEK